MVRVKKLVNDLSNVVNQIDKVGVDTISTIHEKVTLYNLPITAL